MKTLITIMILVFALYFSGCATTQGGSKVSSGSGSAASGGSGGKMLTKEDYDRMGIKEMGAK